MLAGVALIRIKIKIRVISEYHRTLLVSFCFVTDLQRIIVSQLVANLDGQVAGESLITVRRVQPVDNFIGRLADNQPASVIKTFRTTT